MATSNVERTSSRALGRCRIWLPSSKLKVVVRKRCSAQAVKKTRTLIEVGVHLVIACLVQPGPFDEDTVIVFAAVAYLKPIHVID